MHLKIRSFVPCANDEKKSELLVIVSKLTVVSDLKTKISEEVDIDKNLLRLFYMGKELNDSYKVYDYGMKLNDVVQFMVNSSYKKKTENNKDTLPNESNNIGEIKTNEENGVCDDNSSPCIEATIESEKSKPDSESHVKAESKFYKVGDKVDAKDLEYGAWFEAIIVDICKLADADKSESTDLEEEKLIFKIKFERRMFLESLETSFQHIRPRSTTAIDFLELKVGETVLVNYNIEEPDKRGFWYDLYIKRVLATKTKRILEGDIYVGTANTELGNVQIKILDKVYKIEEPVLLTERDDILDNKTEPVLRKERAFCEYCKDSDNKKCKECGCRVCGEKNEPEKMLVCDECEMAYHLKCLKPPLENLPDDDEWFCPDCKTDVNEIVQIGDKLKTKKSKKTSVKNNSSDGSVKVRDWGHGMACVSRTKVCTIVPPNHYGPIPGIEVGMCWNFRIQVSEAGVHRPHVAGIHGRENDGAYSIVLSGGYEDDHDNGETFYYTGSGGRDLSGNKRTAQQSCDQTLTRMNKALALNCNTKLNEKGAEANNWKGGKPVRVVRNYKMGQYSKFAPEQGNRYDGIYKVIKYWPSKGKSGFIVWRYMLRRDDPEPAPWEKNAKKFDIVYPDGYLEAMKMEEEKKTLKKSTTEKQNQKFEENNVKKGTKRKGATLKEIVTKKQNTGETLYEIPNDIKALIADDKKSRECEMLGAV